MKAKVTIERSSEGLYSAYMEDMPTLTYGLNAQAKTAKEVITAFYEVYEEMKQYYKEENKKFTGLEFEFVYDIASFLNYYSGILSKTGLEKITGINQKQLHHYESGLKNPSEKTILKIQEGLHTFAEELNQVKFLI